MNFDISILDYEKCWIAVADLKEKNTPTTDNRLNFPNALALIC